MAARRESPDAETIRVNIKLFCTSPHGTNCSLRVLQWRGMVVFRPKPVLQNERRYSNVVEPVGNLFSFMIHGKIAVPATRAYDDSRPVRFRRISRTDR